MMRRKVVSILGAALGLAMLAAPASAQVSVAVGIGTPRVGASVVVGAPPVYVDPYYVPYAVPYPYYYVPYYAYPYPVPYARVYYRARPGYYYGGRASYYYRGQAPYYYSGRAPYYRGVPGEARYRGNARVAGPNYARNGRSARGNGRR